MFYNDSPIISEKSCIEPDYEKQLEGLFKQQKVVDNFLSNMKEIIEIFGTYSIEKVSYMEMIAGMTILQYTLKNSIEKLSKKIEKEA